MRKIDDIFPDLGFVPALIIVIVVGIALQISGAWITMLITGVIGALFTRRHRIAFLVGLLGVGIAWIGIFAFLAATAQAMAIAGFFIAQLGLEGMGWLVIFISVLLGALLGGFGGLFGRSLVEIIDEFSFEDEQDSTPVDPAEEPVTEE